MKQYAVYILKCADESYYTGITNNLNRRFAEHQQGMNKGAYTHNRRPVTLAFHIYFRDVRKAIAFEKQVKGWGRKKKEALINERWDLLPILAACKNETSHVGFDYAQPDFDCAQPDRDGNAQPDWDDSLLPDDGPVSS